ncbi:hypothetical protein [Neosynechococcus sphagnicola]|uniref:hypothetical protein n=1 Tax=Neosynechococcus sphagnicola TaxID=1501145 RepID=UPI00138E025F|nr:hypothetical protein [Neosynechococcus sphagnicola]
MVRSLGDGDNLRGTSDLYGLDLMLAEGNPGLTASAQVSAILAVVFAVREQRCSIFKALLWLLPQSFLHLSSPLYVTAP